MSRTRLYELFTHFQHGHENVEMDDFQTLTYVKISKMFVQLCMNHMKSVLVSSIRFGSPQYTLNEDLGMSCVLAMLVPKLFSADQKEDWLSAALIRL
ncbi:hypothetical protein AVEN_122537-1 [Araneus ventricosus]|uniref:Uncharacterized protein n=1 Tax=Araneus ventricosus TaxID=182803 RepID=A0A4Y2N0E9_ARAVE|nr:hypothetical protein AVEN_122537-1 [Araneus ventricosus]